MFDRFTDRSRRVMGLARQEAQRLGQGWIGAEHILLGLLLESSGVAANVLKNLGVDLKQLRKAIEAALPRSASETGLEQYPFTPDAKRAMESALEVASGLGHNYIGTEHLLLGLFKLERGKAAALLRAHGANEDLVRQEVLDFLGMSFEPAPSLNVQQRIKDALSALPVLPVAAQSRLPAGDLLHAKAGIAAMAHQADLFELATRIYREVFNERPDIAAGHSNPHRMRAAIAAILAGSGHGDGSALGDAQRTALREEGRRWLENELADWSRAIANGVSRKPLRKVLDAWSRDVALARFRIPPGLAALPPAERDAWERLWAAADDIGGVNVEDA